jgi:pyruvate/2-oxoglutarate dehydrogenase complex dihydrolipoamide acyltransferase (E2) component
MPSHKTHTFPRSRIASIDVYSVGKKKHHVAGLIALDVTESREKIKQYKRQYGKISFTAWLIKVIGVSIGEHEFVAAYRKGKRKLLIFDDINVSLVVEKNLNGQRIPIPLLIKKVNEKSIEAITRQIADARESEFTDEDIVLHGRATRMERMYYSLPGFIRRIFWRYLLRHPKLAFKKMGNVAVTSVGMMGSAQGWFIPASVHPVCFGIGSITKQPRVVDDRIEIREMLHMTILLDHDVIDGAPMARFISDFSENIEKGVGLQK